jgi:Vitamin K-dependent gamma-carboxylase
MKWWNDYWFRPRPYIDLAMVRIITVATQLVLLLLSSNYSADRFMLLDAAPDEIYKPIPALLLFIFPFGLDYRPSFEEIRFIQNIAITVGFFALIGLATRLSLFIFALCNVFIVAWTYSFSDFHHTEAPLFLALGILAFAPVGRVLSVDALLRRRRSPTAAPSILSQEHELAGWAIHLIQWLLVLIYLSAVLSKLVFIGGLDWLNGYTLQYYLIQDTLRKGTLLGGWFSQYHYLVMLSQYTVVIFQTTFALAVIFPRLRWIYVPLGLTFHAGNWILLNAPFPEWIALYAVLIPWQRVFGMLVRAPEVRRDPQVAT